jgi:hypothetical protein
MKTKQRLNDDDDGIVMIDFICTADARLIMTNETSNSVKLTRSITMIL